jgi:hypothetical protein
VRIKRRNIEVFNLSFLDVISCGFGAIILLLVISKITQPMVQEQASTDLLNLLNQREKQLQSIRSKSKEMNSELNFTRDKLVKQQQKLDELKKMLLKIDKEYKAVRSQSGVQSRIKEQLQTARQTLTEEMQRLQTTREVDDENPIGGITVDSEYIIFVIDTSGSMQNFAWSMVRKKMKEILQVHPEVKGVQVMNDMGDYMYSQYAGRWIPDTPARRRSILKRLSSWEPFSNSSPEEGITRAIKHFYSTDKQISIYVFGDDFSRGSIQSLIDTVARLNHSTYPASHTDKTRVRINAIGFPVLFRDPSSGMNIARFAALMRKLAEDNNGSFVGLNSIHP